MTIHKKDVIRHLEKIAIYLELKGDNPFRIAAFRKAANALENDERSLSEIVEFTTIPNIGKGTAAVIKEYIHATTTTVFEQLKQEVPKGLIPLLQLPGLGGKKIAKLYEQLGIENVDDLKQACQNKQVQNVPGFGKKTEENILAAIKQVGKRPERLPIAWVLPIAEEIEAFLEKMAVINEFSRAGSLRRMKETIKDLDFIISTTEPDVVKKQLLTLPNMKEVIGAGTTKVSVTLAYDYDVSVDFRIVEPDEFTSALHHFTGSKEHNVRMRQLAKDRGEKISEYGVENNETGKITHFSSEEQFFHHFQLPYIPPEVREDGKEIERITEKTSFISLDDVKGDLHMHTTWSDGAHSIEEMAEACRKRGYSYIAITDHSQFLKVANGLTVDRLRKQREEISKLNEKYNDEFHIFAGVEMDILPDGTLDFDEDFLQEMDFVIASIHSAFTQSKSKMMDRLKAALMNPYVDMIAHPTGRLIGRREGYAVDIDLLLELAKETNTILELNANPHRLDLSASHLKKANEAGVKLAINTDAHQIGTLHHMEIGIATAIKAWTKPTAVINTMSTEELIQFFKTRRSN